MLTETTLCMGCMNDKTYDGPCRLCGYSDSDPFIPAYLQPKTLLNGRYIVGRLLSYNGEGAIYIGYDKDAGCKITVKEYMPDTLCSRRKGETEINVSSKCSPLYKTYMSEFEDLNRSLMKLRGMTHTQAVLDVFCENNTCYAVYEFINGISLKTFLANSGGGFSWDRVKEIFPPIFTTLAMIHRAGIIHRGISPRTLFVNDKMELMLTGFSISAARTTGTEIVCEMYNGYAAPEQYSNDEMNGTWTDVYGISAVLYRVLTGTVPPEAVSGAADTMLEPMLLNRNIPSHVSKAIMRGLARSPENRIRDIGEFVSLLFEPPVYERGNNYQNLSQKSSQKSSHNSSRNLSGSSKNEMSERELRRQKKKRKDRRKTLTFLIIVGVTLIVFTVAFSLAITGKLNYSPENSGKNPGENSISSDSGAAPGSNSNGTGVTSVSNITEASNGSFTVDSASTESAGSASAEDLIELPDFTDRKYDATVTRYEGVLTFVPTYDYNEEHASGFMYDQSVEAGKMVKKGEKIAVKVSKGKKLVALPDYTGLTGEEFAAKLAALNVKYEIIKIHSDKVEDGYVDRCSKEIGDEINVEEGEIVEICIGGI